MNDAVRAGSDTIAVVGDSGVGYAAEQFLLRLPGRTLDARGCHAPLPAGGTATLDARVQAFFARQSRAPALLVGVMPFDPEGDDALYQPASLAQGAMEAVTPALPFSGDIHAEPSAAQYADAVRQALAGLRDADGALKKVVLARTLRMHSRAAIDPRAVVARLGQDPEAVTYLCPLPVATGDAPAWLVGASPELLVSRRGSQVFSHPLAGSARRRADPDEDAQAARELLGSAKDHDEHRYVVDAIVAALRPYCDRIDAAPQPSLHATTTLWHLGTRIEARLRDPSTTVATLLAALHPTPAVCGTPAALALDTIRRLERVQRGFYAGAVGWMDAHGDGDWYVAIRCARVQGHQARIHAGAGIVAGSDPASEVAETGVKFGALLAALGADAAPDGRMDALMNDVVSPARVPLRQVWPPALVARYRAAGYWRGETFPGFLRERATQFADDVAVVGGETRLTYAQLWQEAGRIGAGLLAAGLAPGDRVVVQLGNTVEFVSVVCGLFRAGLIPVYALPAHRLTEIAHVVRTAEASAYVAASSYEAFDYRTLARELQASIPGVRHVFIVGDAGEFTAIAGLSGDADALPPDPDPQSVAFLQLSGGSTGLSKLIPRTHDDYLYSFRASNAICGIGRDSVYLVALPAAHNFPMSSPGFFGALYAGARVVLSPGAGPDTAFPLIARERVTCVGLVPPLALLWAQAAASTPHDLSSLQVLQVGGAKLVPEAARRVIDGLGCQLQQVFGMAEGLVNYTRLHDAAECVLNTQGRPISPDDEVLVVDDHGNPVAAGEVGHLLTRGPYTIRGYHNDPGANARSFTEDGFYRTGDKVQQLPGGYLVVQGRAGDHINRAGEKISAEEIEDHLLAHASVFDAAVVSMPDPYLGERSCAFVITRGERPTAASLKAWVRSRGLAAFKVPDQVVFVDAFGTTAVGKISRRELRAQLRARHIEQTGEPR